MRDGLAPLRVRRARDADQRERPLARVGGGRAVRERAPEGAIRLERLVPGLDEGPELGHLALRGARDHRAQVARRGGAQRLDEARFIGAGHAIHGGRARRADRVTRGEEVPERLAGRVAGAAACVGVVARALERQIDEPGEPRREPLLLLATHVRAAGRRGACDAGCEH